jgi:hypothetical protein
VIPFYFGSGSAKAKSYGSWSYGCTQVGKSEFFKTLITAVPASLVSSFSFFHNFCLIFYVQITNSVSFFADIRFEATTIQLHLQPLQFDVDGQRAMEVPQGVPREPNLEVPNLRGSG